MPLLLKICDLEDSYDYESDKCDNVKNNEDWNDKGLYYFDNLSEEDNYDEKFND